MHTQTQRANSKIGGSTLHRHRAGYRHKHNHRHKHKHRHKHEHRHKHRQRHKQPDTGTSTSTGSQTQAQPDTCTDLHTGCLPSACRSTATQSHPWAHPIWGWGCSPAWQGLTPTASGRVCDSWGRQAYPLTRSRGKRGVRKGPPPAGGQQPHSAGNCPHPCRRQSIHLQVPAGHLAPTGIVSTEWDNVSCQLYVNYMTSHS